MNHYALFDPQRLPSGSLGYIYKVALVGKTTGKSRKDVKSRFPNLYPVPVGSLRAKERRWLEGVEEL